MNHIKNIYYMSCPRVSYKKILGIPEKDITTVQTLNKNKKDFLFANHESCNSLVAVVIVLASSGTVAVTVFRATPLETVRELPPRLSNLPLTCMGSLR